MNDLCYEYAQDGVFLNSFGWVFVHEEVRCSRKIEIKVGLQHANEKLSLSGNIIIYTPEDLVINKKQHIF